MTPTMTTMTTTTMTKTTMTTTTVTTTTVTTPTSPSDRCRGSLMLLVMTEALLSTAVAAAPRRLSAV